MNKPLFGVIGLVVIVGAIAAAVIFSNTSQSSDAMMEKAEDNSMMKKEDTVMEKEDSMIKADSRYISYTKEGLESAANTKRVLFFYANWCPTCKPADANFNENAEKIPNDVTLIRVNYNDPDTDQEEKDLAKKYNVTYQHTFVQIDNSGKIVKLWNGGQMNELLSNIQ